MELERGSLARIDRELVSVFGDGPGDHAAAFAEQAEEDLTKRQEQVARREETVAAVEERLRACNDRLRRWEAELETRQGCASGL
jgi:flagellar motility protein MotE (MotC chaperone)